ncbi:MAG TPA: hypothetical protein VGR02_07880 [Thermoanaerobaculia bacterium]|nr:hypothetical protein [Thermoanaerobaculia bacterium]
MEPVELADSKRFAAHELREIEQIVQDRRGGFLEAWNEYFSIWPRCIPHRSIAALIAMGSWCAWWTTESTGFERTTAW